MGFESRQPEIIKIAKQINIYFAFLVRLVQTYSVFKQIAKSICNEYSICFSSQKLPYSGASVFVYGVLRTQSQHNKNEEHSKEHSSFLVRRKGLEPPTYWFVASHSIQLSYRRIQRFHQRSSIIAHTLSKCKPLFEKFWFFFLPCPLHSPISNNMLPFRMLLKNGRRSL